MEILLKENQKATFKNLSERKKLISDEFNKLSEQEKLTVVLILEAHNVDVTDPELKVEITEDKIIYTSPSEKKESEEKKVDKAIKKIAKISG